MATLVKLRELTADEWRELERLARSRTEEARLVQRAKIVLGLAAGERPYQVADRVGVGRAAAYEWLHRFNAEGLTGLTDHPRPGRPHTYTAEQRAEVIAAALTRPESLGLPFASWTLDRLQAYLAEHKKIPIKRTRIDEILVAEGLRWRAGDLVRREGRSRVRRQKGAIETLYTSPPDNSVVVCLDEMGPEAAKSFPGTEVIDPAAKVDRPAGRAKQAAGDGRRGKGYIFGAFRPATGAALTRPYPGRTTANWIDFLERVERWVPAAVGRVYAVLDNLPAHRATDVLLFSLAHPRWEFVFQPKYAAYLNLIEPWWKVLRSLALKGRRFGTWQEVEAAVERATAYWNAHRHPFVWGRRRRHRPRRPPGVAAVPGVR
jgi:transposase